MLDEHNIVDLMLGVIQTATQDIKLRQRTATDFDAHEY
jgi:hypothetical protein